METRDTRPTSTATTTASRAKGDGPVTTAVGSAAVLLFAGACAGTTGEPASATQAPAAEESSLPTFAPTTAPAPTFAPTTTTSEPPPGPMPEPAPVAAPPLEQPPLPLGGLHELISTLVVAPEASAATYSRTLFGGSWIDADGDGCDTRCEVLETTRMPSLPGLPGGGWLSAYDGYSTDDPSELDVDHTVPLAEAWRSGASTWDGSRRLAFANDVDHPGALVAVTAAVNRSKGDRDPAAWQPPNTQAWCDYAAAWTTAKLRWDLTADEAEVRALTNIATSRGC